MSVTELKITGVTATKIGSSGSHYVGFRAQQQSVTLRMTEFTTPDACTGVIRMNDWLLTLAEAKALAGLLEGSILAGEKWKLGAPQPETINAKRTDAGFPPLESGDEN